MEYAKTGVIFWTYDFVLLSGILLTVQNINKLDEISQYISKYRVTRHLFKCTKLQAWDAAVEEW